jgi:hypothetical protein
MLKLSKTEALLLAQALENSKYDFCHHAAGTSKKARLEVMAKLNNLQARLETHSDDQRMHGRRSFWDFFRSPSLVGIR